MLPEITDAYLKELEAYINSDDMMCWSTDERIEKLAHDIKLALFGFGDEPKQSVSVTLGQIVSVAAKGIDQLKDFAMKYVKKMMFPKAMQIGAMVANLLKDYVRKTESQRTQIANQLISMVPKIQDLLHPNVKLIHPSDPDSVRLELDKGYGMKVEPQQI